MAYMKIIETSQTWTCPEDGDYEIICVAGGQGGRHASSVECNNGGATSFGTYLTASGHFATKKSYYYKTDVSAFIYSEPFVMPVNGYTLKDYGFTNIAISSGTAVCCGIGYGAGGGGPINCCGRPGKLMITQVTLTNGTQIPCTIGTGGTAVYYSGTSSSSNHCSDGYDGVIVIREI